MKDVSAGCITLLVDQREAFEPVVERSLPQSNQDKSWSLVNFSLANREPVAPGNKLSFTFELPVGEQPGWRKVARALGSRGLACPAPQEMPAIVLEKR